MEWQCYARKDEDTGELIDVGVITGKVNEYHYLLRSKKGVSKIYSITQMKKMYFFDEMLPRSVIIRMMEEYND